LQELFEKLPIDVGFNIEVKYAYKSIEKSTNYLERNAYCDRILQVVFDNAGSRPLLLSCFDPDICALLAKKQPRYPVFFLTEGSPESERKYDIRCTSLRNATVFASTAGLRGIVTDAKPLLADLSIIHEIHLRGLLVFTYGADNNVPEQVDVQKRAGVDAVISDKVTKISSAAKAPVNENVERKLTLALNERAKAAKARAGRSFPFTKPHGSPASNVKPLSNGKTVSNGKHE
jgi:glycerophosphodiester phosphodiesterase